MRKDVLVIGQGNQWISPHLQIRLKVIVPSEVKQNTTTLCIIAYNQFDDELLYNESGNGSRVWIQVACHELACNGFSIQYDEVTRYKQLIMNSEN